jgi:hypothetical protein
MPNVKLVRDEAGDYDVRLDGVEIGTVRKGGSHALAYYPWTVGKQSFATRRDAVEFLVRRHAASKEA